MIKGKDGRFWKKQIELALQARRDIEPWWDANDKAYAPDCTSSPDRYGSQINTNRDFTLTERKKADMFTRRPDVSLQPTPLLDGPIVGPDGQPLLNPETGQPLGQHLALQAHQEIVNEELGPDNVDAVMLAHQTIFDVLQLSGVGFTKLGYESVTQEVEAPDPRDPTGLTLTKVPVPVYERCFWHHFSPKQAVVPANAKSTEFDRLPFLGHQFELPITAGNRQRYHLPADFEGSQPDSRQQFDRGGSSTAQDLVFTGVDLFYRSVLYREDIQHPEHLTHLVLVDGIDEPVIHEDCPYQTLNERGELTPDSLIGYPIHPLVTRTRTDSAWPPADATLTRPLVTELNLSRTQNVQFRDAMTLKWKYNTDVLPTDSLEKIVRSPIGGMIGVPAEAMHDEAIKELPQGAMPRENFAIADYIDQDISRSWALDASQQGVQSGNSQTATAEQLQQANANARLDFERAVVLQWYTRGVTKFSTLIQRYLPVERAAQIVGAQRAQVWDLWRTSVPSALAFTALPDSALRVDQAVDRKASQELYSFLANDPFVNRGELLTGLLRKFHLDPAKIVQQPPPPKPEPPKVSISVKGEDFIGPQAPLILEALQQLGMQFSDAAIQASQQALATMEQLAAAQQQQEGDTKHGGKTAQQESLSKHASDRTGAVQNTGQAAGMGAAGGMLQ